ncbi:MAG: hypothetical protein KAJ90_07620 [Desulfobacterales bacterium]|nr:hypothetical protein [Desulfobacterales bacterium]
MPKHTCFLIHGMGSHGEGWSEKAVTALGEAAVHHNIIDSAEEINEKVEFVEIRYNEIFDGIVKNWNTLASSLSDMPGTIQPEVGKLTTWIAENTGDDAGFATTHALDVAMYFQFKIVSRMVQLEVASQMMVKLASHATDENHKNIVIAHSLGTAVANDAIHRLASTNWLSNPKKIKAIAERAQTLGSNLTADEITAHKAVFKSAFGSGQSCFEAIYMIANVSPVLQRVGVVPAKGYCAPRFADPENLERFQTEEFYNIGHVLDPVHIIGDFRAERAWHWAAGQDAAYDISVKHLWDKDIHALDHYLINPRVYRVILPEIVEVGNLYEFHKEAGGRLEGESRDFPEIGPKYQDDPEAVATIKSDLSKLGINIPTGIEKRFNRLIGYYKWAKDYYNG